MHFLYPAFPGVCHHYNQNPPRFRQNVAGFWQNPPRYNYSTAWNNVKMAGMRIVIQHGASDSAGGRFGGRFGFGCRFGVQVRVQVRVQVPSGLWPRNMQIVSAGCKKCRTCRFFYLLVIVGIILYQFISKRHRLFPIKLCNHPQTLLSHFTVIINLTLRFI